MFFKKLLIICALFGFVSSATPMSKIAPMADENDYAFYVDDMENIDAFDAALIIGTIIAIPAILCTMHYMGCFDSQGDALDSFVNHYEDKTQSLEAIINVLQYDNEVLARQLASAISSH